MLEHDRLSARILERLTRSHSSTRSELVQLLVDQALSQCLREAVDLEQLRAAVLAGLTSDNVRRVVDRHAVPAFQRYASAVATHAARVGLLVSPLAHQKLHAAVRAFRLPPARWAENSLDPVLIKQLLR